MDEAGRTARGGFGGAAFTLIELMVATAILVVVVMIVSSVFHQSTVAWDGGMRKAEGNMTARAVVGLIARELVDAVVDGDNLKADIQHKASRISFVLLKSDRDNVTNRIARRITYQLDGDLIRRKVEARSADALNPGQYGGPWRAVGEPVAVAERVASLRFVTADGKNYTTNLPAWVRIELSVRRTHDISGVSAVSAGPNGVFGESKDNDDIRSL